MEWIKPPYYVPDRAKERVDAGPFFPGGVPTAEAMLQTLAGYMLTVSGVNGFLWGWAGEGADSLDKFHQDFIDYAKTLTPSGIDLQYSAFQTSASVGFNAEERGKFYADLVVEKLKQIQACSINPMFPYNLSVFDVWMSKQQ